jgi:hypothetical protein
MDLRSWIRKQEMMDRKEQFYNEGQLKELIDTLTEDQKESVDRFVIGLARYLSSEDDKTKIFLLFQYTIRLYAKFVKEGYSDVDIDGI